MEIYNPKEIEAKWQEKWLKQGINKNYDRAKKFYALDMFPYPSGAGLHVGHPKGYIATDVVSRYKMLQGYSVLHPMGWDAFGLPAENYAIKNKVHPRIAVQENIATFKKQLEAFGFTYDWDREISTTDPEFYRWTQWIFLKLFENELAYESNEPVNWCPSCKTVLSNEDLEGGLCERCGNEVEQKPMRQWVLKMTQYADRLLYDLDSPELDWEDSITDQQRNWIGRSEGVQFAMKIKNSEEKIEVYTTRIDTAFGITYTVVAPEHKIIGKVKNEIRNFDEVFAYINKASKKTNLERTELQKEKTGVKLEGIEVINPFTNEAVPLFVADYVLGGYGTGAVMAVPAHDERDFEFAKKYNLPIKQSVAELIAPLPKDTPREGKETIERKNVNAILKNPKTNQVYCLDWENFGWTSFVIGGIEESETEEQAAIRELKEESGYQNFKLIKKVDGKVFSHFYAAHKDINRFGSIDCFYFELAGDEFIEPEEKHVRNHKGIWIDEDKVSSFINLPNHLHYWEILQKGEMAFVEDGILIDSGEYLKLTSKEAREKMADWLEREGIGKRKVNYKMRDWVYSRQRYWGEPIPIIHCEKCGAVGVPEDQLPVTLPEVENYEPTGTGESPLANIPEWVNTICPKCGGPGKRETNTMPQWGGSSWYYLRYIDPKNNKELVSKELEKEWMPVDLYVGGAEHATRHLLYARFWHKFLFDIGVVSTTEPFKKLVHVGLIMAEDGRKMSKRWNNVINPDDVIGEFGADAMRLYEMFMGPFTQSIAWSTDGVKGVRRFLDRVWKLQDNIVIDEQTSIKSIVHKTIKKVTEDIENFRFNTAISSMMILVNETEKNGISKSNYESLLQILSPFASHMTDEIWERLGHAESIFLSEWPKYDPELIKDEEINLVIQVNGKVRDTIVVSADITEEEAKKVAMESKKIKIYTTGKEIRKIIFVAGKILNIVV